MKIKEQRDPNTLELTGYLYNGMFVPLDPSNRHYQEIQELIKAGEPVEPAFTDEELFNLKKEQKLQEINSKFNQALGQLANQYPQLERESWAQQEKEARAYIADNTASTPLLDALSTARNVDKLTLANKIVEKADAYAQAAGALIGKRQSLEDLANAANTIEELEAIVW